MNMTKAAIIHTDNTFTPLTINSFRDIQEAVGGTFCAAGDKMFANDEGLIIGLPFNAIASALYGAGLAGDVVIHGGVDEGGELIDLPNHVLDRLYRTKGA